MSKIFTVILFLVISFINNAQASECVNIIKLYGCLKTNNTAGLNKLKSPLLIENFGKFLSTLTIEKLILEKHEIAFNWLVKNGFLNTTIASTKLKYLLRVAIRNGQPEKAKIFYDLLPRESLTPKELIDLFNDAAEAHSIAAGRWVLEKLGKNLPRTTTNELLNIASKSSLEFRQLVPISGHLYKALNNACIHSAHENISELLNLTRSIDLSAPFTTYLRNLFPRCEVVEKFLQKGVNATEALIEALAHKHPKEIIETIIRHGADVDHVYKDVLPAMFLSTPQTFETLLRAGCNLHAKDSFGREIFGANGSDTLKLQYVKAFNKSYQWAHNSNPYKYLRKTQEYMMTETTRQDEAIYKEIAAAHTLRAVFGKYHAFSTKPATDEQKSIIIESIVIAALSMRDSMILSNLIHQVRETHTPAQKTHFFVTAMIFNQTRQKLGEDKLSLDVLKEKLGFEDNAFTRMQLAYERQYQAKVASLLREDQIIDDN